MSTVVYHIEVNNFIRVSLQKIYDDVTEDIFNISNVRILKEIEKKKKW